MNFFGGGGGVGGLEGGGGCRSLEDLSNSVLRHLARLKITVLVEKGGSEKKQE